MGKNTAIPSEKEIDEMKLGTLTRLLREEFDMTEDETEDLEKDEARAELKKRVTDILATAAARRRFGQAAENLREILEQRNSKRHLLAELCNNIATNLSLDKSIEYKLKIQFDCEVKEFLKDVQGHLDREECHILVAGETSSGKSTFLNLLLGEYILPVAHLSSTSTICEVKYGETRQAVVHMGLHNDEGQRQITIPLDGTEERQAELRSYMHLEGDSRDKQCPVEKIQIFWPLPLLKGGIVLVDSPGVGESELMDKVVADYIPKCFAFLYIIDSSRAGGVQTDRFGQLIELCAAKKNAEDFHPESAMFICNKWDTVPAVEEDKVKSDTVRKLSQMWPDLKESQVFFVATRKAIGPFGILSEDFTKVLDGLDLLLPKSLDIKLETQYRLLTRLLTAALFHINIKLNVAHQDLTEGAKLKTYQEAKGYLQSFQDRKFSGLKELGRMLSNNVTSTKDLLSGLVNTGNLKKDMMAVEKRSMVIQQVRLVKQVKKGTSEDFSRLRDLYDELANTLSHCDTLTGLITSTETSFKRKLKEVAKSLEKSQQQTMEFVTGSSSSDMEVLSVLFQHEILDTIYNTVTFLRGSAISSFRWLKWEAHSSTESILHNCWKQAPVGKPLIDILMEALKSDELLTELVERQVQPQRELMALLGADITKMSTIMDLTIEETYIDTRSNEEIVKAQEPQIEDINGFLGQLAMFHLTEMRKYEYDLDSITGLRGKRNSLGGGSFDEVFRVQVPWKGAKTPAALKLGVYPYNITTTETAWEFLKEEDNLRKLQGNHIVEYYGTACRREVGGLRLGLVTELCVGTLEDKIIGNRDRNPAWWSANSRQQAAAFSYTQNLAVQLCEGLRTVHDAGYIHRDLKLSNVLVTRDNIVKLADVGLTKQEVKIRGSKAGTPLYTALEVKEQKMYRVHKSADIYSLGLILWEMWYGIALYGHKDSTYTKHMEEDLKEGKDIRMPRWEGTVPPIPEWTRLIHDCLNKNPKKRPKIQECLDRITAMKVDQNR